MSTKGFSFQKSEKGVPFEWRKRPSSDNSHEEQTQLSNLSEQAPGINRLLGIWLSALALFMARLLLVPLERTHQPFYKRFLWAALMLKTSVDNLKSAELCYEQTPSRTDSVALCLLSVGIIGYIHFLVHLLRSQHNQQPRVFRLCIIGILAFLGGGLLQQNMLDALLETVPLAINVWMTLEVTVIARLSRVTAIHRET